MTKKILIVEDDQILADMYKLKFKNEGFDTHAVNSGKECLDWLKKTKADLLIIDIMLPKMNGLQLIKNIRKNLKTQKIKIVILTNLTQSDINLHQTIRESLAVDGFFEKSKISPSQLVKQVSAILK